RSCPTTGRDPDPEGAAVPIRLSLRRTPSRQRRHRSRRGELLTSTDSPEVAGFLALPDLAVRSLGGAVVWADDEFFAEREALVRPGDPAYSPATFGGKGQIYDGWETRRRRAPGHDSAIEGRSEEHTSELQSRENLVCRLLLEKKKKKKTNTNQTTHKQSRQTT